MNVKITIAVPVYGVETRIERCAVSLFEQTYDNIEYIFINDCTPDNSIDILKETIERYPERKGNVIIHSHSQNEGLASSRNSAIRIATGDYIMHVDSDDFIDKKTVELCVEKQKEGNYDIVSYGIVGHKGHYLDHWHKPHIDSVQGLTCAALARRYPVNLASTMIKLSLYKENNIVAIKGINMSEDYQVMPKLFYYARSVAWIDDYLYHYDCTNENSYTASVMSEKEKQVWVTIDELTRFFRDKGDSYLKSLEDGKISIYIDQKIKAGINCDATFLKEIIFRINKTDRRSWKKVPFPYRLILMIDNLMILRYYILFSVKIKNLIKIVCHRS